MRLLALHGVGSNAKLLERQLAPFMDAADPAHEFIFIDGPWECRRGPGMSPHSDGPFFSHVPNYTPDGMLEACENLEAAIQDEGPFDGVIGFSQGAALCLSYMHLKQGRRETLPFSVAICFSSVVPCSADETCCKMPIDGLQSASPSCTIAGSPEQTYVDLLHRTVIPAIQNDALLPVYDMNVYFEPALGKAPRVMHPSFVEPIRTPTAHIMGKRDDTFMKNMSQVAYEICDERTAKRVYHSLGHDVPQKLHEVKEAVRAMEWAISQSEKVGYRL